MKELFKLFLRLGLTAFGGPAAHIAMMRNEVVRKKHWLNDADFLNLVGLSNLIPGPNSTELAIHIGYLRKGWKGLVVAGLCFILPAVFITGTVAYLYKKYGALPEVLPFIYGIRPAVIAVIAIVLFPLFRASAKNKLLKFICVLSFILALAGGSEIIILFSMGIGYAAFHYFRKSEVLNSVLPFLISIPRLGNTDIFLYFLKIGSLLYGSGYVLFAFINDGLVANGLLSRTELMDAISVGQFTPGPVFSSVTFIGYQLNGFPGAIAATLGVFLPSFIFVGMLSLVKEKLLGNALFMKFLDAVRWLRWHLLLLSAGVW